MFENKTLPKLMLFNTESRAKEPLEPIKKNHVTLYTCGPTVYDFAHIGNFRTYVFEDLLRRTIKFFGYSLTHVMNITDVDDKTIKGATKKGVSLEEYVAPYVKAFFEDLDALKIERAEHYPAATDYIPQMIEMIQSLIDKGAAYQSQDGCVYYNIETFPRYGCLSHLNLDDLKEGASERICSDEYDKEHIADFVVWKKYNPERDGSIYWESPFGKGRPGWHMECSTMAMNLLGETLDIHVGGVDNMFPHHENEIAQSEAHTGKRFANIWLHSEHLLVDNKKMSKSLGNFYTFRDLVDKGFSGTEVRYMLMQTHYKTQLNFTLPGLEGAQSSINRMQNFVERLLTVPESEVNGCPEEKLLSILEKADTLFVESLADDLNISVALSAIFDLIRDINSLLDARHLSYEQASQVIALMKRFNQVIGVLSFEKNQEIPAEVLDLVEKRQMARSAKNWRSADELRDSLLEMGFLVEDSPTGPRIHKR